MAGLKTAFYVLIILTSAKIQSIRLIENVDFTMGGKGFTYDLYDSVNSDRKLTIMAWIGVKKLSNLGIMRIDSSTGYLNMKAENQLGSTSVFLESQFGFSDKLAIVNTSVDTKNWARVALSFEINTNLSTAYLFVEGQRSKIDNIFAGVTGINLVIGSSDPISRSVDADISFLELTFLNLYLTDNVSAQAIQSLFEFEPNLNILTQIYKHGPYTKRYFNHVNRFTDVRSGNGTSFGVPSNLYTSIEFTGSNLNLIPRANYRGLVDQSYLFAVRLDVFYHGLSSSAQRLMHPLTIHSRVSSSNTLIFENIIKINYANISTLAGIDYVELKNTLISSSETILETKNVSLSSSTNKLSLKLYVIKVRKTLLDQKINLTVMSDILSNQTVEISGSLQDSDFLYAGPSNLTPSNKFSTEIDQMAYLKIYEISFFQNTYIDWRVSEADKIKVGAVGSSLVLDCDAATEGIRRASLADPYNVIYNSCISEPYVDICSVASCNICQNNICYDCKLGYELDSTLNTCTKCEIINNKIYDPFLRICLPYISTLPGYSGSNQYSLVVDPTAYGLNYGVVQSTEVYESRLVTKISLSSIVEPSQYKLYFNNGSIQNYNILQFFDNSIIDEDGFVYLSFDIPDINGPLFIERSSIFSMTGFRGGKNISIPRVNNHFKNFSCYNTIQAQYVKVNFNTVSCETICSGQQYVDNTSKCTNCPTGCTACTSMTTCSACSNGFFLYNGVCIMCSQNCATCLNNRNNCQSCSNGGTLNIGAINNNCVLVAVDSVQVSTTQTFVNTSLLDPSSVNSQECDEGYYYDLNNLSCKICFADCLSCISSSECIDCTSNSILISGRCITQSIMEQEDAAEELETDDPLIDNCGMQIRSKCIICTQGFYRDDQSKCSACNSKCDDCVSADICLSCISNFEMIDFQCFRSGEDNTVYLDEGVFLDCSSCDNCYDCLSCFFCLDQIEYTANVDANSIEFIFPAEVVLIDNIVNLWNNSVSGLVDDYQQNSERSVLSRFKKANKLFTAALNIKTYQDPAILVDSDYLTIKKLSCNINLLISNVSVSSDGSSLKIVFNPHERVYDCYLQIRLKQNIIKSLKDGRLLFRDHMLNLEKATTDNSGELENLSFTTTTKLMVLTFAIHSQQSFNALVFYIASINLLNLFLLTQPKYYYKISYIVSNFMLNFELKIKITEDQRLKSYYDSRFAQMHIVSDVLEGEYFYLLDIRIFFVVLAFFLRLMKKYISKDSKIINNKYFIFTFLILEKFSFAYVTCESFIFLFRRILLYRYLDTLYASWAYFIVDQLLILFITYGIYKTVQIHTSVSEKFILKQKYTDLMMYYHPEIRFSQFYTSLLFFRNFTLAIIIMYIRNNSALLAGLVNIILLSFVAYTLRLVIYIKETGMVIHLGSDIAIIMLFNIIMFFTDSNFLKELLLFSCLAISSGFIAHVILSETKKIKCESIIRFFN